MKSIVLYTCGDSNDPATWSNVPYLFAKTLEESGIRVYRVNIAPQPFLNHWYNTINFYIFQRLFKKNACPTFSRSWLHRFLINRKLKKTAKNYDTESSLNLFLSYSFINKYSKHPNVLWCDWSDAIVIERIGRQPKKYERKWLEYEASSIKKADRVYTMFPMCKKQMERLYGREFIYLERNVINTLYDGEWDLEKNSTLRYSSNIILFIGNHRYKSGASATIQAVRRLREKGLPYEIAIIGMTKDQIGQHDEWIHAYGYLNKGNKKQNSLYYKLLLHAKFLINPTSGWAGYSSLVEAMYYGCPVITSPFEDFATEFGRDIEFGSFTDSETPLHSAIEQMGSLPQEDYMQMCLKAHASVNDYTWEKYIEAFIDDLRKHSFDF